jgi:hypothetical protein
VSTGACVAFLSLVPSAWSAASASALASAKRLPRLSLTSVSIAVLTSSAGSYLQTLAVVYG